MPPVIEPQNASDILKILFQNYDKTLRPKHAGTLVNCFDKCFILVGARETDS